MATIYRLPLRRRDPETGKKLVVRDADGNPVMHPKWRVTIRDHRGRRRMVTLGVNKAHSQRHADQLEQREREIRIGVRPPPEPENRRDNRPFDDVSDEYMVWGMMQGGRRGLPWDDEHARKKEKDLQFWREALGLATMDDAADCLPKVEAECKKMFEAGNSGKTVSNRVQNLRARFRWCCRRRYLKENPLLELGRFNSEPTYVRRAMTVEEFSRLLSGCAPHRRLLYEVAACSGLRANELRRLEPADLDRHNCALRVDRMIDKGRVARTQFIPAALMERLAAFVESGDAGNLYARIYRRQGQRPTARTPPEAPLLYVPYNTATMLKRDLDAAGVAFETKEGRLDFHALRTAYVNFLLDVGAAPKELQDLARHQTLEMTMNTYGRTRTARKRSLVEALGEMLFAPAAAAKGGGQRKGTA
jgi:integrase